MSEVRVPRLVGVPGGKESLLISRPPAPEGRAGRRFFFASLIRMTHLITFLRNHLY